MRDFSLPQGSKSRGILDVFPTFRTEAAAEKIRCSADDDLISGSLRTRLRGRIGIDMVNSEVYYGYILKGDLHGAISYIKEIPEQFDLYNRFIDVFEREQYLNYSMDADLNDILVAYQQYYRDVFYLGIEKELAEDKLRDRLTVILGVTENNQTLCDLEQNQLVALFKSRRLHFMGGKTSGYYGPYIWRTTETVSYEVELPNGIQTYAVKLLDGFITRSWIDYLSFGEIAPGGWADGDGFINCVKSAYDFDSEKFRVSLLKHEAQHASDLETNMEMSSEDLEYRAKLVELIYSNKRNLLPSFFQEADTSDVNNGHAMAAYRIMREFAEKLGVENVDPTQIPLERIQNIAYQLFKDS